MAFNSIPSAWIASGKFAVQSLWQYIKDNFDYLYSVVTGASGAGVVNGSFEIDSDSNGVPDNWTWNAYTGGTLAIETTDPGHGAKGIKITSPGGSGNGGGYVTMSGYAECSQFDALIFGWMMKSSVADIRNIVRVLWYKKDQTDCTTASSDIYDAATGNPTAWTPFSYIITPPVDARYYKLRLIGADSSDTTAGNCMFDGVWGKGYSGECVNRDWTIAEETSTDAAYADKSSTTILLPTNMSADSVVRLTMYASVKQNTGGSPAKQRFRVGTSYSTENSHTSDSYVEAVLVLYVYGFTGGTMTVYHQLTRDGAVGTVTGKKDKPWVGVEVLRW